MGTADLLVTSRGASSSAEGVAATPESLTFHDVVDNQVVSAVSQGTDSTLDCDESV